MAHNITKKKLLIEQQLKTVVEEHNQTAKLKEQLFNKATELKGALKVLQELDHVHTDQNTEGGST